MKTVRRWRLLPIFLLAGAYMNWPPPPDAPLWGWVMLFLVIGTGGYAAIAVVPEWLRERHSKRKHLILVSIFIEDAIVIFGANEVVVAAMGCGHTWLSIGVSALLALPYVLWNTVSRRPVDL